jgi:hypothetical protein
MRTAAEPGRAPPRPRSCHDWLSQPAQHAVVGWRYGASGTRTNETPKRAQENGAPVCFGCINCTDSFLLTLLLFLSCCGAHIAH